MKKFIIARIIEKTMIFFYNLVDTYDGVNTAIKNAKRKMAHFNESKDLPSKYDPGTKVHELVAQLKKYLDE